jgi:type II secretory pathway component PulK
VLQRLFELAAGVEPEQAEEIAAAIEDWRDEDDKERPKGAEGFYYRSLRDGYDCQDGPFEHPEELLLVRGVTPEIYRAVEPYVTPYGWGRVNLNTAGRVVLQALGLSEAGVAGLLAYRGGENSVEGDDDDRQLVSVHALDAELAPFVPQEDLTRLVALVATEAVASSSDAFRTTIESRTEAGAGRLQALCVMDREGSIRLWSER